MTLSVSVPPSWMHMEQAIQDLLFKAVRPRLTGPAAVLFSSGLRFIADQGNMSCRVGLKSVLQGRIVMGEKVSMGYVLN
jgi:hypothetical protein